jgi:hypothetical protein
MANMAAAARHDTFNAGMAAESHGNFQIYGCQVVILIIILIVLIVHYNCPQGSNYFGELGTEDSRHRGLELQDMVGLPSC